MIFTGLDRAGANRAFRLIPWRKRRLLILCYHAISQCDEHDWNPELYIPREHLEKRLAYLRRHDFNILPLDDAVQRLYNCTLPRDAIAITFDDGGIEFYNVALPILKAYDAPATVYLTTYHVDVRLPVFDTALSYILWKGRENAIDIGTLIASEARLRVETDNERKKAWSEFSRFAKTHGLSAIQKNELLIRLAQLLGVDGCELEEKRLFQLMTPDMVRSLPDRLVDVQLHTHRHRTPRVRELFEAEVRTNILRIAELRGNNRLSHFCYPSNEYFGEYLEWLPEFGIKFATTCVPDIASRASDPLLLPRFIDTCATTDAAFASWVSGTAALLPKRRQYRINNDRLTRSQDF